MFDSHTQQAWLNAAGEARDQCSYIGQNLIEFVNEIRSPSVVYRPRLFIEGNQWCALYGDNIMEGVAGFGDTPYLAMQDFDRNWIGKKISNSDTKGGASS